MDEQAFEERRETFDERDEEYKEAMRTVAEYSFDLDDVSETEYDEAMRTVKRFQRENFDI